MEDIKHYACILRHCSSMRMYRFCKGFMSCYWRTCCRVRAEKKREFDIRLGWSGVDHMMPGCARLKRVKTHWKMLWCCV